MADDYRLHDDRWHFHTSGPNCHWCAAGKTALVWGLYGTNVCADCQALFDEGRQWEVAETVAARITVRGRWVGGVNPERWRDQEHQTDHEVADDPHDLRTRRCRGGTVTIDRLARGRRLCVSA
jgi:hypothetical protein